MVIQRHEPISKSNQFDDLEDIGEIKQNGTNNACYSDNEDFVDDISDQELLSDFLAKRPQPPEAFENVIIIDNVPIVGSERLNRLKSVILKLFKNPGEIANEFYPLNKEGMTKGYFFFEYATEEAAKQAVKQFNGYHLDKTHTIRVNLLSDIEKYENYTEITEPIQPLPYKEIDNLYDWLLHPEGYDQFLVLSEQENKECLLSIYLNIITGPQLIIDKEKWTDKKASWSPQGTYLVTFHPKGIRLYGTSHFEQIQRFLHPYAEYIFFSPCERYFITFSGKMTEKGEPLILWEVLSGAKLMVFSYNTTPIYLDKPFWPPFKWSFDGSYFARISGPDKLCVYNTTKFSLIDKNPMIIKDIVDFEWCPSSNILSYWVREEKEIPAKLFIISIPDKIECRPSSTLGTVTNCKMLWGDYYLTVFSERYAKKKKGNDNIIKYSGITYVFEIFHLRESEIPKDTIEFKNKILNFQPEPKGNKLAIITEHQSCKNVYIYEINKGGKPPTMLKEYTLQKYNKLFWCPNGQFLVLAETGSKSDNGALLFLDTADMTKMSEVAHPHVDIVKWDFSGRYLATAVSLAYSKDNGYRIWSFQGKPLSQNLCYKLRELDWRPRLRRDLSLITSEQIKEIKKNLKKYSTVYDLQDKALYTQAAKELTEKRKKEKDEYDAYLLTKMDRIKKIAEVRERLIRNSDMLVEESYDILQSEESIPVETL
ncbi:unnamed protein product [Gordionus sp. m RMFG-2023]|uniref:eukaryotic translation initiation factor 3 subunit B-like n=1 Tax=Gordionus sp. m RMFG-2023 TaxID=3053472 RepID=UPI0030DE597A